MNNEQWHSLHVFTGHQERVLRALRTFVDGTALAHAPWFYLRYWDGGPHVRLYVRTGTDQVGAIADLFRPVLAPEVGVQLMERTAYEVAARRLARAEGMEDFRELQRAGTILTVPGVDLSEYGDVARQAAALRHFQFSSEYALGLVDASTELRIATCVDRVVDTLRLAGRVQRIASRTLSANAAELLDAPRAVQFLSAANHSLVVDPALDGDRRAAPDEWRRSLSEVLAVGSAQPLGKGGPDLLRGLIERLGITYDGEIRTLLMFAHLLNNRLGVRATAERAVISTALRSIADGSD